MSKDLKNEYENLLESEIPDLWSRIEPKLHEKAMQVQRETAPGVSSGNCEQYETAKAEMNVSEYAGRTITEDTGKNAHKKANRKTGGIFHAKRIYLYSGIAAACLCLVIAIPVIVRTSGKKNDAAFAADTSGAADMIVNDEVQEELAFDAAAQESEQNGYDYDGFQENATTTDSFEFESDFSDMVQESDQSAMAEDAASGKYNSEAAADSAYEENAKAELLEICGVVQEVTISDDLAYEGAVLYEICLDLDDRPRELSETDLIRVVQYPDENGNLENGLTKGSTVRLLVRYDGGDVYELVEIE